MSHSIKHILSIYGGEVRVSFDDGTVKTVRVNMSQMKAISLSQNGEGITLADGIFLSADDIYDGIIK